MAEAGAEPQRPPRSFRERRDVLHDIDDAELLKHYHLNHEGIMFVTELVRDASSSPIARNKAISPELKVITTLRYLATGKMQQCSSDDLGPSQQTISRIIKETVYALSSVDVLRSFIKFPCTPEDTVAKQRDFKQIGSMSGMIGVIDSIHVQITAPKEYEAEYVNRKRQHTINVQVVFDQNYKFIDVVAQWPGSVHDARILRESPLFPLFEGGHVPPGCHLLGDSGYPSLRWLLTPYHHPLPGPQTNYNR